MLIRKLGPEGLLEITLSPTGDSRGWFMRTYDVQLLGAHGININWVQENHSYSGKKSTVRGLHFQLGEFAETKLVRCISGSVFDVAVDLRKDSEYFGKWTGLELSADNMKMLLIPRGFAHGFCTLQDNTEVLYKVDNYYSPGNEYGIMWNDPDINIEWPLKGDLVISEKDLRNRSFRDYADYLEGK